MRIDKDLLKQSLTVADVTKILSLLGSAKPIMSNGNYVFQNVCHHNPGDEMKFKLYYYENTRLFKCYTHCDDAFDIFGLVEKSMNYRGIADFSFEDSVLYVADTVGHSSAFVKNSDSNTIDDWGILDRYVKVIEKQNQEFEELKEYKMTFLEVMSKKYYAPWIREGITIETMDKYHIRYYVSGNRIIIPHFDINGRLVGVRGRAVLQKDIDAGMKYMPIKIEGTLLSHPTSFNLFGLTQSLHEIEAQRRLIIFEGEKSVLLCDSYYGDYNYSVAISGSNISEYQSRVIKSLNIDTVIIAMDKEYETGDEKGQRAQMNKVVKMGQKFAPYFKTYIVLDREGLLDYKDSPTDKGKLVLEKLMESKIEIPSYSTRD